MMQNAVRTPCRLLARTPCRLFVEFPRQDADKMLLKMLNVKVTEHRGFNHPKDFAATDSLSMNDSIIEH